MYDNRRDLLTLLCLALIVRLLTALLLTGPPYMDAYYYTAGAYRLAEGHTFAEPFLWHYLDDPTGIPHPGFLYWMPLPSILAAPFVALLGRSFLAAQLPFILLSALLPLVSYSVAWQIAESRRQAWAAGLLTLFSGFFTPFWVLPETFAPFALFGSLALWLAARQSKWAGPLASGLLVGLAHLTRADGILLLPIVALAPLLSPQPRATHHASRFTFYVSRFTFALLGYLLVMAPWFLRNMNVIGAPLSPAGTKTLWLTNYDDLFCYNCDLSLRSYLAWGWPNILHSKLFALWTNFQRLLAEDFMIFLLPFSIIGFYRLRRRAPFTLALIYLLLIYSVHSLAFTFPGWRGGLFHSSGVLLPFLHTAAVIGLDTSVRWVARRRRGWNQRQAQAVFSAGFVLLAVLLSLYGLFSKLPAWNNSEQIYRTVGDWLAARSVPGDTVVMARNPPGFWYHTARPAVVVPNDGVEGLLDVAQRYHVAYLLLDRNCPALLRPLYAGEEQDARLRQVAAWGEEGERTVLYTVESKKQP
ncbi:MAG: glycosyltransferase family 39 protein [Chloroflexi bacterium]|nr:glycosyltransferase family 39 protein [Chloroflexota bacterium]